MANKCVKNFVLPLILVIVALLLLFALNLWTEPRITSAKMQGQLGPALEVMPNAKSLEELQLDNVPPTVENVWKETSGQGYVVKVSTNKGYTKEPIVFYVAIDGNNKVQKINVTAYPETREVGEGYVDTYIGQDSTLSGAELVAGVTYSSSAIKNGVADAFSALSDNNLIVAAKKEPKQLVEELLPEVFGTAVNPANMVVAEEFASSISGVNRALVAGNGGAVAYWYSEGEEANWVVVTNGETSKAYDLDGNDVTSSFSSTVLSSLSSEAKGKVTNNSSRDMKRFQRYVPNSTVTEIPVPLFNNATTAFECVNENGTYYGFGVRPYGFGNGVMTMYIAIDSDGKIFSFNASSLILEGEFFNAYTMPDNYAAGFVGINESWSGDEALISGATMSSDAVKDALNDVFASFNAIKGGK